MIKAESPVIVLYNGRQTEKQTHWQLLKVTDMVAECCSVSAGIVSAVRRRGADLGLSPASEFIQTDAACNVGSSGGPLVNVQVCLPVLPSPQPLLRLSRPGPHAVAGSKFTLGRRAVVAFLLCLSVGVIASLKQQDTLPFVDHLRVKKMDLWSPGCTDPLFPGLQPLCRTSLSGCQLFCVTAHMLCP